MIGSMSMKSNFLGDSLIGSLPRGLSVDEKRLIAQSTPLSPTLNMLSAMPSVRLQGFQLGPVMHTSCRPTLAPRSADNPLGDTHSSPA